LIRKYMITIFNTVALVVIGAEYVVRRRRFVSETVHISTCRWFKVNQGELRVYKTMDTLVK